MTKPPASCEQCEHSDVRDDDTGLETLYCHARSHCGRALRWAPYPAWTRPPAWCKLREVER